MLKQKSLLTLTFLLVSMGAVLARCLTSGSVETLILKENMPKQTRLQCMKQIRSGVQKDLWLDGGQVRFHHRITSPRSILITQPKKGTFELVEEMQEMICYFQKRIHIGENPCQEIQWFKSNRGRYLYAYQRFDADEVLLACFKRPGITLATDLDFKDAFLKGGAKRVSISLKEHPPNFHAETFKAHIHGCAAL